jgi:hypothetical protein
LKRFYACVIAALCGAIIGRVLGRCDGESPWLVLFFAAVIVIGVSRLTGWPQFRQ